MEKAYENAMIAMEFRKSNEGKRLGGYLKLLNKIANELLEYYVEENCCSELHFRHFKFQCPAHEEHVIATYHTWNYAHLGMEEVEQFVIFMAAYELYTFINEHETCPVASKFKDLIGGILNLCIIEFDENIYVVDTRMRAAQESTNILQEEDDESLSLGMPMSPQEEDKEEQKKEEEDDQSISLGMPMQPQDEDEEEQVEEEWSSYPSPTPNNGNIQIPMNNPSYTIASDDDSSLPSSPLCGTIVSNIWEDESDIIELDDPLCSLDDLFSCGDSIQNYVVKFTFDACKHYERGRDNSPLYVSTLFKMQATDHYVHWIPQPCCYLFIYKMPMHRKKVRLKY